MIISHKHQFIFIKTKKTAGTSIEIALSAICGDDDVLTPIEVEDELLRNKMFQKSCQNSNIPFSKYSLKDWIWIIKNMKRFAFYNHMPARVLKKYVDTSVWNTYYKFCFEREPVDKSISHYKWLSKKKKMNSFERYLQSPDVLLIKGDRYYKDVNGNYLVDKVYKMEDMEEAFKDIAIKLNLEANQLKVAKFITKQSTQNTSLNPSEIKEKYEKIIKSTFKTEYKDFYTF